MLTDEDFHRLTEFRCGAMGRRLREMVENPAFDSMTFEEKMKDLIDTEVASRQENKIAKLVKRAGFKIPDACVEDILYLKDRRLSKDRISRLAECTWVEECGTVVIISRTSGGKTYIAQALGTAACRKLYDVTHTRLTDICTELNQARVLNDGTYYELLNKLKRVSLLIIDDFMTTPIKTVNAVDLFEIMEARENRRATLIASQLEPNEWYLRIEGELMADSILSRIATGATYIDIEGPNMREYFARQKAEGSRKD